MRKYMTDKERMARRRLHLDFATWRDIVNTKNRFDINNPFLQMLDNGRSLYQAVITNESIFYRGRIFNINDKVKNDQELDSFLIYNGCFQGYSRDESGAPPPEKTVEGRLNCVGIPYLYTSESEETVIYELRPICKELISVATCVPKKELLFADCTRYSSRAVRDYDLQLSWLLHEISIEFSRPHYNWRNYWFTQYIAGHFYNMKFDGVVFESSLDPNGKNYVFFYPEDCEITESYLMRVNNIKIDFEPTTRKREFEYD